MCVAPHCTRCAVRVSDAAAARLRHTTADGMLIYKQLGANAQEEFAKTWGIGYALDNASEWQEVLKTAAQAAVILVRTRVRASTTEHKKSLLTLSRFRLCTLAAGYL